MGIFDKKTAVGSGDFGYLNEDAVYLDAACQSLRPLPVIEVLEQYYKEFNSCGERVKYKWGRVVDEKINEARGAVLRLLKLSNKEYFVSFTLNTTYGINLILNQIKPEAFERVVTSDIEHNSPFLSTIAFSKKNGIKRTVLAREADGSVNLDKADFTKALVVVNAASNIDGRKLKNVKDVVKKVHAEGGIIILDAAQAMAHSRDILEKTEADAVCFSAHKMYSASLGVMVIKKSLLQKMDITFIGGGMVDDVPDAEEYKLSYTSENHISTIFEPGLQLFGEIVALGEAIKWLQKTEKTSKLNLLAEELFNYLKSKSKIHVVNAEANPTISFYVEGMDSHLLASGLSTEGIMARSGYFCCHYYLDYVMKYPPLLRFSLGYHTRQSDIDKVKKVLDKVVQ